MTSPSLISFDYDRIHKSVEDSVALSREALTYRLPEWNDFGRLSERSAGFAQAMIESANMSVRLEEALLSLMTVKDILDMLWDEMESKVPPAPQGMDFSSAKSFRLKQAIAKSQQIWEAKNRVDGGVAVVKRAVERLTLLQNTASRAAGIALGPA